VYWDNVSLSVAPAVPAGGCCLPTGECFVGPQEVCASIAGSTYFGDDTTCESQPCPCTVCPPNDACDGAIEVAIPSTTLGSTKLARNDADAPSCSGTSSDAAPGVWYKLAGNWHTLTASTCNSSPYYDMQMAVYCGGCGWLTCVAGNDDGCWGGYSEPSKVTWCARYGLTYWIRVYGWGGQVGDFQLDISDDGVQCAPTPECEPPVGACCVHGVCSLLSAAECGALGGTYQGDGGFCEPTTCPVCRGDADCSGAINFDDINYFVAALAGQESGWSSYYASQHSGMSPPCTFANCDVNADGGADFNDINPFVEKLVASPACP
jgi:hypothetical protein